MKITKKIKPRNYAVYFMFRRICTLCQCIVGCCGSYYKIWRMYRLFDTVLWKLTPCEPEPFSLHCSACNILPRHADTIWIVVTSTIALSVLHIWVSRSFLDTCAMCNSPTLIYQLAISLYYAIIKVFRFVRGERGYSHFLVLKNIFYYDKIYFIRMDLSISITFQKTQTNCMTRCTVTKIWFGCIRDATEIRNPNFNSQNQISVDLFPYSK